MPIQKFAADKMFAKLPAPVPAAVPIGEPVSQIRSLSLNGAAKSRTGVWECSPGVWRRQILQAEFCTFLAGSAVFEPDDGEPLVIKAGDSVYFPANTAGVWRIETTARKTFVVFDEA